jgi:dipeptidyl aminopeptidase/acylaminoacyl peptidase
MFRELGTVSTAGGDLTLLTETPGKLGGMTWSPNGAWLAFVGAVSQNDPLAQSVFVVPAAGGAAVNRTPDYHGSVTSVDWLDNETVTFLANEGTRTTLNRVEARGGDIERIAGGGQQIIGNVSFDGGKEVFAAVVNTATHPNEVYAGNVRRGALERISRHNEWLEDAELARQETIEWMHPDGTRVEGVLVRPLGEQPGTRYPLAMLPHGGPEGVSLDGWTTRALYPAQVLAASGYAVLMPNYRGSGGRGVAFSKADHRDLGGKEFEDVIAGIDFLSEQGLVDPKRVGSSGTSYGGYFSAWAGTRHADRFAAAITFAGITNWASFTGTTDIPYEMSIVHWDLWWFDNPGLAWDRSPVAHANDSSSPTLVMHGAVDQRVHPAQSLELYQALKINEVPTGLVVYPREPHGLLERAHQLDFMHRIIEWLDRYVKAGLPATG